MAQNLTKMQEVFAQELFKGLNQSAAYRVAYPKSKQWTVATLNANASRLAKNSKVVARLDQLRAPVARKLQYGVEEAMEEALQAFRLAATTEQPGAMVAAATLRAKLQGLLVERKEIAVTKMDGMGANDKAMVLEAARAELARRKALTGPDDVTDVEQKE